jgi:hypothetical protein
MPWEPLGDGKGGGIGAGAGRKFGDESLEAALGYPVSGLRRADDGGEVRVDDDARGSDRPCIHLLSLSRSNWVARYHGRDSFPRLDR